MDSVVSQSLKLQDMFRTVQMNRAERAADESAWEVEDIESAENKAISLFRKYLTITEGSK